MPKHLMAKLNTPESLLYMSPLRAIVVFQQYCIITVIWSIIVLLLLYLHEALYSVLIHLDKHRRKTCLAQLMQIRLDHTVLLIRENSCI